MACSLSIDGQGPAIRASFVGLCPALRTQVYLKFGHDPGSILLGDMRQEVSDQVLLSALAKNHAVDRERTAESMDTLGFTTEKQRGHMAFDFCIARKKPIGNEV